MLDYLYRTIILVASVIVLSSCGERGPSTEPRTIDDANIPIILNENGPQYAGQLYAVEEDLILGIDDGEPEWQIFGTSIMLMVGDAGRMYIADQPSGTIYIVSHSGELTGQFGARGSGPGEYLLLLGPYWIEEGSEVWIGDFRLRRITRFSSEGKLLDTIPYATKGRGFGGLLQISGKKFLGYTLRRESNVNMIEYGFLNDKYRWIDAAFSLRGQEMFEALPGSWAPLPFKTIVQATSLPNGRIVLSDPYDGRITVSSDIGDPQFHITRDWEFPSIPSVIRQAKIDLMSRYISAGRLSIRDFPDQFAAFDYILTDDQNQIWVRHHRMNQRREENPDYYFSVFDSVGAWLGMQLFDFNPNVIKSGYAYDVRHSELHGPKVIRYKLTELNRN